MNDNHTRLIIWCVTFLGFCAMTCGTYLVAAGYQAGEQEMLIASAAVSGLLGFLGGRAVGRTGQSVNAQSGSDVTVTQTPTTESEQTK